MTAFYSNGLLHCVRNDGMPISTRHCERPQGAWQSSFQSAVGSNELDEAISRNSTDCFTSFAILYFVLCLKLSLFLQLIFDFLVDKHHI